MLAAMAVSGCTTGSMSVSPTAAATGTVTATALPSTTPTVTAFPVNGGNDTSLPAEESNNSTTNESSIVTAGASFVAPADGSYPYNGSLPPGIDMNITVDPAHDTTVVLTVTGNVNNSLSLTKYKLMQYPQISENVSYLKHGDTTTHWLSVSGASLNALLNDAQPNAGATSVTFRATDGYETTITLSEIRADSRSIIAINSPPDGSLRNVLPSQTYGAQWGYDLYAIVVV